ncbi:primase-helicase zinc-binding domain-containing protein [Acinetobacter sp. ANC 4641]|uniref:primase-helicase zinc-binding domain-containing protein n=1 Tax=Acinetobacter sp. ANC 4641 TaxID=2529847 RepID=UPI00103FFC38|nr:primase-helicase zinc-binding domain-containing protein [Acinetobacter sp. ANC 4641]TCB09600.1 toprim domain-containing protein [Acinetobacter sp. ANC 4641]
MALTFDQVRDTALGKWKDLIFPAFAITVPAKKNQHGPCPICGGTDRFRCDDKQGKGTFICNQCGAGDGFELIVKARGIDRADVLKEIGAVLGLSSETKVTDADRKKWREKAEQQRLQAEMDERKAQESAAKRAERTWKAKSVDRDCPYLDRKQVKNHGCKINGKGNLLVPLFDISGKIWNVQEIHADGHKPYLPGGRVNDCFYIIGEIIDQHQIVCIAEGYATAASIFEATSYTTVVAFQSGNIDKVGIAIRSKYPNLQLVYCADDDSATLNAGLKAANKAVAATGGIIVLPDFKTVEHV